MDFSLPQGVKAEAEKDVVGGNGPVKTDIYPGVVEMIYLDTFASGAINANIVFKGETSTIKEQICISNKAGEFTYKDKKTGEDKPLPGYSQVSSFLEAITGTPITEQVIEEKTIKVYDFEAKSEVPVKRKVFMNAVNKPMQAAIQELHEEKTTKESDYKEGTGEFYEKNTFIKFLDSDTGRTVLEQRANTEAEFAAEWLKKNKGKVRTKKAAKSGVANGATAGAPAAAGAATTSLFT